MNTYENYTQEQAALQYETICRLVDALSCDFDRLEELRNELEELKEAVKDCAEAHSEAVRECEGEVDALHALEDAIAALELWYENNKEEFDDLAAQAGEFISVEDVEVHIQETPLSMQVRSGWVNLTGAHLVGLGLSTKTGEPLGRSSTALRRIRCWSLPVGFTLENDTMKHSKQYYTALRLPNNFRWVGAGELPFTHIFATGNYVEGFRELECSDLCIENGDAVFLANHGLTCDRKRLTILSKKCAVS